ncbi:alpha/beta hydrolase [Vagococcus carniphilus]|uniref:alpha/beta hydrolase n=1 Tax=Vagococcus carniphilus TaxID=218144 RepID=UPI0028920436|nr:alpha/beta hydrolase [Vagococcus carniphilus]MDT2830239.1 alpha/beta hydrolase [Vagococcus carniphilus]MDT2838671.1 alpha/beta hydrolase [Vagococcus carniphilus]MDT2853509.1 alpha/beta hydrolase [Vagococcus carniphilus]
MKYTIQQGKKKHPVLILLHGTGGDETSLLEVGNLIDSDATKIGIRGNVLENGYPRYFKRLTEGVFDEVDLAEQSKQLHETINELIREHSLLDEEIVLVGYSNGANIAIRLLLDYPDSYQKGILFHPMYPVDIKETKSLEKTAIFASFGKADPIVSMSESYRVSDIFSSRKASMTEVWSVSHQLTYEEIESASQWLVKQK